MTGLGTLFIVERVFLYTSLYIIPDYIGALFKKKKKKIKEEKKDENDFVSLKMNYYRVNDRDEMLKGEATRDLYRPRQTSFALCEMLIFMLYYKGN